MGSTCSWQTHTIEPVQLASDAPPIEAERGRERETERQRDRERERERLYLNAVVTSHTNLANSVDLFHLDRETERHIAQTERQRDRETEKHIAQTETQIHRETEKHIAQTETQTNT